MFLQSEQVCVNCGTRFFFPKTESVVTRPTENSTIEVVSAKCPNCGKYPYPLSPDSTVTFYPESTKR